MMDLSSIIDAALVLLGSIAVLAMGLWTLSFESSTASTSEPASAVRSEAHDFSLPKAA